MYSRPLYQKWNSSSAPVLRLRAQQTPLPRFLAPYLPWNPSSCNLLPFLSVTDCFLSPVLSVFAFIFLLLPSCLISLSPLLYLFPSLINKSLPLSFPTCLSLWQLLSLCLLPLSLSVWPIGEQYQPSVSLCDVCPQGKQLWWGPNALLIPVTSQNIPADAHMGTLTYTQTL